MKVLLREDVDNLGYAGEVLSVADGYGRNYLIPRGLAVKATEGVLREAATWRERAAARLEELRREHQALSERILDTHLVFTARAGETGKLYGSVTSNDIVDQLNEELGTDVDRRAVTSEPLRQLGEHQVTVRLSRDYTPQVTVFIHPLSGETEEADEEAEEQAAETAAETAAEAGAEAGAEEAAEADAEPTAEAETVDEETEAAAAEMETEATAAGEEEAEGEATAA
ncbi:MAG: 50S ribosomal protein L9 [Candidatus Promineifilaceae bacterium]|nr:50S ribosomal protein L9 [Candidatus Promineifilaceae bacterium]